MSLSPIKRSEPCQTAPIGHADVGTSWVSRPLPGPVPSNPVQSSPSSSARINPPPVRPAERRATIVQYNPFTPLHQPIFAWIYLARPSSRGPHSYNVAVTDFDKVGYSRSSLGKEPFPGCLPVIKGAIRSNHSRRSRYGFQLYIGLLQLMFPVNVRSQSGKSLFC